MNILALFLAFSLSFIIGSHRSVTQPNPDPHDTVQETKTGQYKYTLMKKGNSYNESYYLTGPHGEVDLKTIEASLSPDGKFLAYSTMTGEVTDQQNRNRVTIKDLETDTDLMQIYIAAPDDPAANFAWSPDLKYLAFTSVGVSSISTSPDLYPKGSKFFVVDYLTKQYRSYDLELMYTCGSLCLTDELKWSSDSTQLLSLYREFNADRSNWEYRFAVVDAKSGKILRLVDYPDHTEEASHYEFSPDGKSVRYYLKPGEWKEIKILP